MPESDFYNVTYLTFTKKMVLCNMCVYACTMNVIGRELASEIYRRRYAGAYLHKLFVIIGALRGVEVIYKWKEYI